MAVNGKVTVDLDRARLRARFERGKDAAGKGVAEQVISDCNLYSVPDDGEHALKDSARPEKDGETWAATWNTVYAAYQYYGCWPDGSHVVREHTQGYTPNPSTQWVETARAEYGKGWERVAQREYVKGAGG